MDVMYYVFAVSWKRVVQVETTRNKCFNIFWCNISTVRCTSSGGSRGEGAKERWGRHAPPPLCAKISSFSCNFQEILVHFQWWIGGGEHEGGVLPPPAPKFLHFHATLGTNWSNSMLVPPPSGKPPLTSNTLSCKHLNWITHPFIKK